MRLLRISKSSHANKVAFLGAQAFLTGSICRHLNPAAGFSSVSVGSTKPHSKGFVTNSFPRGGMGNSIISGSSSSSRLFSTMDGPSLTNVNKEVGSLLPAMHSQSGWCHYGSWTTISLFDSKSVRV